MSTLQEAIEAVQWLRTKPQSRTARVADKLLGKFKGLIPPGSTSTKVVKALRRSLYGKFPT
jgi:hypothetical protein